MALSTTMTGVSSCSSSRTRQAVQLPVCLPGETASCVAPDAMVRFRPTVTDSQIEQYMNSVFQTKAQVEEFHGSVLVADYPRDRVLGAWGC
jgi:hypothetical protein